MLNQFILIGKFESLIGNKIIIKNDNNKISLYLNDNLKNKVAEYLKKDDIIGIKGKITSQKGKLKLVIDKITFLS